MHTRFLATLLVSLAATLALTAPTAAAYTALPSAQIVAKLNEFRAANGFPATVHESPALTAGCRAHNRWMQRNNRLQHPEIPGTPLYSEAGNEAGNSSILAQGSTWRLGNPWLNAPIHLADALMPGMLETGASEEFDRNCLTTHTTMNLNPVQPATDTFWSYPKPDGTQPFSQTVAEAPAPPQTFGPNPIPDGTATGPNLITFYQGPRLDIARPLLTGATLTDAAGRSIALKLVDEEMLTFLPPGAGIVIPRSPLTPNTTYTWTATYTSPARAPQYDDDPGVPAFTYTSEPRTFRTTAQRLCGTGAGGWYRSGTCPVAVVSARAPRRIRIGALTRGLRIAVRLDDRGLAAASAKVGRRVVGFGMTTIGATRRGTLVVRVNAAALRRALGSRRSVTLLVEVSSTSGASRTVRVLVTR